MWPETPQTFIAAVNANTEHSIAPDVPPYISIIPSRTYFRDGNAPLWRAGIE
jgi:hypothetical protein